MSEVNSQSNAGQTTAERRQQATLGNLSDDFLRVDPNVGLPNSTVPAPTRAQQEAYDAQLAQSLQAQESVNPGLNPDIGRIHVTIAQAKLAKNYGITKMDPYCRIRVGHRVLETPTNYNGAKNPRWNKTFVCPLPSGVDSIYLEIFDERSISADERVAWSHIQIPPKVMDGDTVEDWFSLTGKEGEDKEGMINIIFSYKVGPAPPISAYGAGYQQPIAPGVVVMGAPAPYYSVPTYYPAAVPMAIPASGYPGAAGMPPQQQQPRTGPIYTEEDLKQVTEMFSNIDAEVVKSVMDECLGNKDKALNALLQMSSPDPSQGQPPNTTSGTRPANTYVRPPDSNQAV